MDSNYLSSLFRRLRRQHRPVDVSRLRSQPFFYFDEYARDTAAYTREVKQKERPGFESFMRTGVPTKGVKAFLTEHGTIQVLGRDNVQDSRVLMTMTKEKITANAKRSNHIAKLLEELAERERLEMDFTASTLVANEGIAIAFWKFKYSEEVDDSELVNKAKPDVRLPERASPRDVAAEQMEQFLQLHADRMRGMNPRQMQEVQQGIGQIQYRQWQRSRRAVVRINTDVPF